MASDAIVPIPVPADLDLADVIETIIRAALAPVMGRIRTLETAAGQIEPLQATIAALAAREGAPGPVGPPGAPGLGIEDLQITYDGERTITHRWSRGDQVREHAITVPALIYRGVHVAGREYARGDCVTVDGSIWHCNGDTTARPGDGSAAWTLAVKRGRDLRGPRA